jgi:hypothetical protein
MSAKSEEYSHGRNETDEFLADNFGIKRRKTGTEFSLTRLPVDLTAHYFFYEAPLIDLKVGFDGVWVVERLTVEREGNTRSVHARVGAIMVAGQLHAQIKEALASKGSSGKIQRSVDDCVGLIAEYIRRVALRHFNVSIAPRIYEASEESLSEYLSSGKLEVGLEVVGEAGAKQIF